MNTQQIKNIFIVAGAAGEIGTEFCKALSVKQLDTIAIIRNKPVDVDSKFLTIKQCDLSSSVSITQSFDGLRLEDYDKITFVHLIGGDKYDPRGYPNLRKMETIDPDIYDSSVNTFKYPLRYLIDRIRRIHSASGKNIQLKVVLLGGIPDKFTPFVVEGFCEAKNICREYIRSAIGLYPTWVSGLAINVSSTITRSALRVRPHADVKYWLRPEEVVKESLDALLSDTPGYDEVEIFKYSPDFAEGYYENNEALYEKWSIETGTK